MAKLNAEIFVLCDHASISQEQKLSIIGIFDQFFVTNLPTAWPKMYLVAVVRGEAGKDYQLTLKLSPPTKTQTNFPDKQFAITLGQNGKANVMTELVNFPLTVAGIHKIQLLSEKDLIGEIEFKVNKTTATYSGGQDVQGKKIVN